LALLYWLEFPEGTSVIMASTTRDALPRRRRCPPSTNCVKLSKPSRPESTLTTGPQLYLAVPRSSLDCLFWPIQFSG
jgi:hypothetical protein